MTGTPCNHDGNLGMEALNNASIISGTVNGLAADDVALLAFAGTGATRHGGMLVTDEQGYFISAVLDRYAAEPVIPTDARERLGRGCAALVLATRGASLPGSYRSRGAVSTTRTSCIWCRYASRYPLCDAPTTTSILLPGRGDIASRIFPAMRRLRVSQ